MSERVMTETKRAIEAVLMAAIEPVEAAGARAAHRDAGRRDRSALRGAGRGVRARGRGFALVRIAGGYRYQTHPDMAPYIERFVLDGQTVRLSAPALETLAIIAYKQPVSRAQLSAIRGVNVESTIATLIQRGYVAEIGHDPGPGQAILYGTTPRFLEQMGSTRSRTFRRWPSSCPSPRSSRRSSVGCTSGSTDRPRLEIDGDATPSPVDGPALDLGRRVTDAATTASGCRRSSPRPGIGSRRACEELIVAGPGHGRRRGRGARSAGRPRARRRSTLDGVPVPTRAGLVYYLLEQAGAASSRPPTIRRVARPWWSSCRPSRGCIPSAASTGTPRDC